MGVNSCPAVRKQTGTFCKPGRSCFSKYCSKCSKSCSKHCSKCCSTYCSKFSKCNSTSYQCTLSGRWNRLRSCQCLLLSPVSTHVYISNIFRINCMISVTSPEWHHPHLHYDVLHVLMMFWMKKSWEFVFVCHPISVCISISETSLVPSHHLGVVVVWVCLRVVWGQSINRSINLSNSFYQAEVLVLISADQTIKGLVRGRIRGSSIFVQILTAPPGCIVSLPVTTTVVFCCCLSLYMD